MVNGQREAILFGPLLTHLDGLRRDLPPLLICIYFLCLSSIFHVAFLSQRFCQIPPSLMFKIITSFWISMLGRGRRGAGGGLTSELGVGGGGSVLVPYLMAIFPVDGKTCD